MKPGLPRRLVHTETFDNERFGLRNDFDAGYDDYKQDNYSYRGNYVRDVIHGKGKYGKNEVHNGFPFSVFLHRFGLKKAKMSL